MKTPVEKPTAAWRKPAFGFIFIAVLLDMLSLGIILPVLPNLVVHIMGDNTEQATKVYGFIGATWALMQFLSSPIRGVLSDGFGRRPLILISCIGVGIDYIIMAIAPAVAWVFVGHIISGITSACVPLGYAYVADVTTPDRRAARFGLLGAAIGAAFIFGPAIGGYAANISLRLPFEIAAGLCLSNAIYTFLVLPESLPRSSRIAFGWQRANPFGALALLRSNSEIFGLACVNFLLYLAQTGLPGVSVLYMAYRYGWDERVIGLTMAGFGVTAIIVQSFVVAPVTRRVGEATTLILGLAFGALGFVVLALARSGSAYWLLAFHSLRCGNGNSIFILALMSRSVTGSQQGMAARSQFEHHGYCRPVRADSLTQTFAYAIGAGRGWQLPGAPFPSTTILLVLAGIVARRLTR